MAGGVGAFALSFGGSGSGTPVLVKADASPVKVKPESPGGTSVPNQDKAVYETVAAAARTVEPQQEKLVTTAEEPVDVSPPLRDEAEELPGLETPEAGMAEAPQPKGEDRIAEILQQVEEEGPDAAIAAVAPRKVRTMIVRPDGTLVPREELPEEPPLVEDLAEAAAEATLAAAAPAAEVEPIVAPAPDATAATSPADAPAVPDVPSEASAVPAAKTNAAPDAATVPDGGSATATPALEAGAATAPAAGPDDASAVTTLTETSEANSPVMPDIAPIAPQRPAEQPVEVVGEVTPAKVAALAPAAPPATGGGSATIWSVQIASQPNEAAARSTYRDLAGRYGSVLDGREVSIVKAEIAGRGTFWRVRVPADSRNEAIRPL